MRIVDWTNEDGINCAKLENGRIFYTDRNIEDTAYEVNCFYACPAWEVGRHDHPPVTRYESSIQYLEANEEEKKKLTEIFRVKEGETVLDVGAYYGFSPIRASELVGSSGRVLAIEGSEDSFGFLLANIVANNLENVMPVNAFLWSESTTIIFHDAGGKQKTFITNFVKDATEYPVVTTTVDHMLENLNIDHVDIVFSDISGADYPMLLGATKLFSQERIRMIIDYYNRPALRDSIVELFRKNKFKVVVGDIYKIYAYKGRYE